MLNILLSPNEKTPIYKQIEDSIKTEILNGSLKEGSPLPSIRELALELGVSVITVKGAYEALTQDGFIYSYPGKGFFVSHLNEETLSLIKKQITLNTIRKQIAYLKKLGVSEEDIRKAFKDEIED